LFEEPDLPSGADHDLVREAQAARAHVFLTRDRRVLRVRRVGSVILTSPGALAAWLLSSGADLLTGATCGLEGCPYEGWGFVAPDIGKWGGLLSIFERAQEPCTSGTRCQGSGHKRSTSDPLAHLGPHTRP
jgi:hypothetical protein